MKLPALLCLFTAGWLASCAAPSAPAGPDGAVDGRDTGDGAGDDGLGGQGEGDAGACAIDPAAFQSIGAAEPAEIATVIRVSWQAPEATRTWVRYTDSLGLQRDVPMDSLGGVSLRGLQPDAAVPYRLVAEIDGALYCTDTLQATTGALPGGLPELVLSGDPDAVSPAFMAITILTPDKRFAVVVDTLGQIVWAWEPPAEIAHTQPIFRAAFSLDGEAILVNTQGSPGDPGALWRVPWSGADIQTHLFENIHRDFVELPDGGLAFLGWESRSTEGGELLRGDVVFELSPAGDLTQTWNVFDDFPHDLGTTTPLGYIDGPGVREWTHANALSYDSSTGAYLIGLPELTENGSSLPPGSLISVDRDSRALNWELSYQRGDFDLDSPDLIEAPHSLQRVEGGLLVFNRGGPQSCSRANEIALDFEAGEATSVWSSLSDQCVHTTFLGEAHRLPDGDTILQYSSAGQLDLAGEDGTAKWRLQADLGAGFGFVDYRSRLYGAPLEPN